jgi:hypothetical protein
LRQAFDEALRDRIGDSNEAMGMVLVARLAASKEGVELARMMSTPSSAS